MNHLKYYNHIINHILNKYGYFTINNLNTDLDCFYKTNKFDNQIKDQKLLNYVIKTSYDKITDSTNIIFDYYEEKFKGNSINWVNYSNVELNKYFKLKIFAYITKYSCAVITTALHYLTFGKVDILNILFGTEKDIEKCIKKRINIYEKYCYKLIKLYKIDKMLESLEEIELEKYI